jgi:RNA polymerase sigma factor (sigma-70 family)
VGTAGNHSKPTDAELLAECRSGQGVAWDELVVRYGNLVYSVSRATGLSDADAADITQQTFCILHDSIDRLRPDTRLGPWLATVARRHSWRIRARQKREAPEAPDELTQRAEAVSRESPESVAWEQLEWLHHGLSLMDERCRDLLTELYLRPDPASYEELAPRLGIAVGSIGPIRARCLEKLRNLLEDVE